MIVVADFGTVLWIYSFTFSKAGCQRIYTEVRNAKDYLSKMDALLGATRFRSKLARVSDTISRLAVAPALPFSESRSNGYFQP